MAGRDRKVIKSQINISVSGIIQIQNKQQAKEDIDMSVLKITKQNFDQEVLKSDKPVLLDFYADWCGPCRMVSPIVDEIAEEHKEIKVGKVNVDDDGALAQEFGINAIPALIVVKNGEVTNQAVGARPKADILALLRED